jgi:hypothetical protein
MYERSIRLLQCLRNIFLAAGTLTLFIISLGLQLHMFAIQFIPKDQICFTSADFPLHFISLIF